MSFRLKTILGVAAIEIVLLLILVFGGIRFLSDTNAQQLVQRAETASTLFTRAARDAVLSNDLATLDSLVDEALKYPDIVYVKISKGGITLAAGGDKAILNRANLPDTELALVDDQILDRRVEIEESGVVYGVVEMGLSTATIEKNLAYARQWALSVAGIEILLVAIFSFILGTYLTRQLLRLKAAAETVAESGPGHEVNIQGKDELALVANAFNTMSSSLEQSYRDNRETIERLEKSIETANRNEDLNRAILSASLDAMIAITDDGVVTEFNDVATQIFGWKKEEIIGHKMHDFIVPPELRAAHLKGMQHYLETGEGPVLDQRIELPALHKAGHQFPIEISISPLLANDKAIFIAFIRDITRRKEAETELRLAAQTFDSDEAITIADENNKIIRVNKAFTRITGYEAEEVIGKDHSVLSSGQHDQAFYREMWQQILERGNWSGEIYNRRKDGEIYPEHLNISTVRNKANEITHYVAHFVDISKQKENEKKLLRAQQEAEAANAAKGLFLANMSHEIRTPMNGVLGILDLLTDSELNPEQKRLVETGQASGIHLLNIINDILDYSKMDADRLELASVGFDLHTMLDSVTDLMRPQAEARDLSLVLEKSPGLTRYLVGDPFRLRQVLLNLISNAIKFTERGEVRLRAASSSTKPGCSRLRIVVEDTGIGIPPEAQEGLFDVFTMADQSHARTSQGTGLGLAICRQLVTLMGGTIGLESEVGTGSRFHFEVELEDSNPDEIREGPRAPGTGSRPRDNTRVLLAEDNPANQAVIKGILERAGLIVDLAENGLEAVEAVRHTHYDIVLMDISMPQVDGIEATRRIRALEDGRGELPIVAITAHALPGDSEVFLQAGMDAYLTKPIDRDRTLGVIAGLTGGTAAPSEPRQTASSEQARGDHSRFALLDESVLQQLARDTGPEILPELFDLYSQDARARVERIARAAETGDFKTLQYEAHTLGSSAGAHANLRLQAVARDIEACCRDNNHARALEQASLITEIAEASLESLAERGARGFT